MKRNQTYRGFESPLAYFYNFYGNQDLTKSELKSIDSSLYESLRIRRQLDKISFADMRGVLTGRKPLSYDKVDTIKKMLERKERTSAIAHRIHVTPQTVRNYKSAWGLKNS